MEKFVVEITEESEGSRIDKALIDARPDWSRSQVQQWMKDGLVLVGGKQVKASYKMKHGDVLTVEEPDPVELDVIAEDLNLDIVYEDADVLVVNKPRDMVVHPAPGHPSGTVVNGLMYQCKDLSGINGVLRPGIVHRIDKDTSGLLMVAKNDKAHVSLVNQLVARTVTRVYIALVHGHIPHDNGTIDAPIGRHQRERQSMTVTDKGKHAITHFKVLERFGNFTLVECKLETGRTHQIRVHMKYIGFPLAGDPKYGPKKTLNFDGQLLHAGTVGFIHPETNEYMEFTSPPPDDFLAMVDKIRNTIDNVEE